MALGGRSGGAVAQDEAAVVKVAGVVHRRDDADVGAYASDNEVLDAAGPQDQVELGAEERILTAVFTPAAVVHGGLVGRDVETHAVRH